MWKRLSSTLIVSCAAVSLWAQASVDTYVAVTEEEHQDTYVIIISNENYKHEVPVPFALNDGAVFQRYCQKTLGIPEKNIKFIADATLNDMNYHLSWLERVMNVRQGEARAIVYYSGHGMPDEDSKKAYLLPIDGYSTEPTSGLSTEAFYKRIGNMPSKGTLVLLDACFSGSKREGGMMQSARGVAIKAKNEPVGGNMVVFAATQSGETAYPLKQKEHGLFTYYILEQLQKTGGSTTMGELADYVTRHVAETSIVENEKSQTPTVTAAAAAGDWRSWTFTSEAATRYENMPKISQQKPAQQTSEGSQQPAQKQAPVKRSFIKR